MDAPALGGQKRLWAGLACLGALGLGAEGRAISVFQPFAADLDTHYTGAVYRYQLKYVTGATNVDLIRVSLQEYLELLEVRGNGGQVVFDTGELRACYQQSPLAPCIKPCAAACGPLIGTVTMDPSANELSIDVPIGAQNWPAFELTVRMGAGGTCGAPTAQFQGAIVGNELRQDAAAATACQQQYVLAQLRPDPPVVLTRSQAGAIATFGLKADVEAQGNPGVTVGQAIVNELLLDPSVFATRVHCVGPSGVDACSSEAFASLLDVTALQEFPVRLEVQAKNPVGPPQGGIAVRLSPKDASPVTAPEVVVEGDVAEAGVGLGALAIAQAQGASEGAAIQEHTFVVIEARNAQGGNEPMTAEFSVIDAVPSDWLEAAQSWLHPSGSLKADPHIATPVVVTVQGQHANPSGSFVEATTQFTLLPGPGCFIAAGQTRLGFGQSTDLEVQLVADDGAIASAQFPVTWQLTEGQGTVLANGSSASSPSRAVYTAPLEPTRATVTASFPDSPCKTVAATVGLEVAQEVRVELEVDREQVLPGSVANLRVGLQNLTGRTLDDLSLELDLGSRLKSLHRGLLPVGTLGIRIEGVATDERTLAAAQGVLGYQAAMPAHGKEQTLSMPVLARHSAACGDAEVGLRVLRGDRTLASDRVTLRIQCDPEFSEATLFGKVYDDANGNGTQEPGELGIAGAMVAISAGMVARTDDFGRYHMVRLQPGRHSVKLNPATLPAGARVSSPMRREITLTPGMFTRQSFAVQLADLALPGLDLVPTVSGLGFRKGQVVYRAVFQQAKGHTLVAYQDDRLVRPRSARPGSATLELPVSAGGPHWLLVQRARSGQAWVYVFGVHTYGRKQGGRLVVPWGPRPILAAVLPAEGQTVHGLHWKASLRGFTEARVELVASGGEASPCEEDFPGVGAGADNSSRCVLRLTEGAGQVTLQVDPGPGPVGDDPPELTAAWPVQVEPNVHFLVGLAGAEAGYQLPSSAQEGQTPFNWDAGGAFFYQGELAGGVRLTAGADGRAAQARELPGGVAGYLLGHDPRRVFRDLDPEDYYPTYGDDSVTVDERESGGRFHLRIESDEGYLKWGGINTAIDDTELARYTRSLYGLGGALELWDGQENGAQVQLFAAQPDSAPGLDILVVTGGSLYFLRHRDLVQGSLRVTLEVLDEVSGLAVRAVPLTEGVDYEADYLGGRVTLDPALAYRGLGGSLTGDGGSGRGRLLIAYEYVPGSDLTSDWSLGTHLVGHLGAVQLGVTGVAELGGLPGQPSTSERYLLAGSSLRVDLGEPLQLRFEVASSHGGSYLTAQSYDGGQSYHNEHLAQGRQGTAALAELATAFGGLRASLYGRYVQPGFSDAHNTPSRVHKQAGARLDGEWSTRTRGWLRADHRQLRIDRAAKQVRNLGLAGASQSLGPWRLAIEGRHEWIPTETVKRTLAGAEIGYRLGGSWELSLRRRQVLAGGRRGSLRLGARGETAVGVIYAKEGWSLGGEVGVSDALDPLARIRAGMPLDEATELYTAYRLVPAEAMPSQGEPGTSASNGLLVGGRRRLEDGVQLFAEQALRVDGRERWLTRSAGGELPLAAGLRINMHYERGSLHPDDSPVSTVQRDAFGMGLAYDHDRFNILLRSDVRVDDSDTDRRLQFDSQGRAEVRLSPGLSLAAGLRGGSGYNRLRKRHWLSGRYAWEGSLGFAVRPVETDWFNAFGRYALTQERDNGVADGGVWLRQQSHVAALAVTLDLVAPVALSPKVAYRNSLIRLDGKTTGDQALIGAVRADLHLTESWDSGIEGRVCAAPGSRNRPRYGALAEASALVLTWVRLGVGYNFSAISASAVRCQQPGARGFFLRAEAIY